jgi:hypothetical protein
MEGPISFWGYKEQESNLILREHDDDDDDDDDEGTTYSYVFQQPLKKNHLKLWYIILVSQQNLVAT